MVQWIACTVFFSFSVLKLNKRGKVQSRILRFDVQKKIIRNMEGDKTNKFFPFKSIEGFERHSQTEFSIHFAKKGFLSSSKSYRCYGLSEKDVDLIGRVVNEIISERKIIIPNYRLDMAAIQSGAVYKVSKHLKKLTSKFLVLSSSARLFVFSGSVSGQSLKYYPDKVLALDNAWLTVHENRPAFTLRYGAHQTVNYMSFETNSETEREEWINAFKQAVKLVMKRGKEQEKKEGKEGKEGKEQPAAERKESATSMDLDEFLGPKDEPTSEPTSEPSIVTITEVDEQVEELVEEAAEVAAAAEAAKEAAEAAPDDAELAAAAKAAADQEAKARERVEQAKAKEAADTTATAADDSNAAADNDHPDGADADADEGLAPKEEEWLDDMEQMTRPHGLSLLESTPSGPKATLEWKEGNAEANDAKEVLAVIEETPDDDVEQVEAELVKEIEAVTLATSSSLSSSSSDEPATKNDSADTAETAVSATTPQDEKNTIASGESSSSSSSSPSSSSSSSSNTTPSASSQPAHAKVPSVVLSSEYQQNAKKAFNFWKDVEVQNMKYTSLF